VNDLNVIVRQFLDLSFVAGSGHYDAEPRSEATTSTLADRAEQELRAYLLRNDSMTAVGRPAPV